jgi:hypothetical protein
MRSNLPTSCFLGVKKGQRTLTNSGLDNPEKKCAMDPINNAHLINLLDAREPVRNQACDNGGNRNLWRDSRSALNLETCITIMLTDTSLTFQPGFQRVGPEHALESSISKIIEICPLNCKTAMDVYEQLMITSNSSTVCLPQ